MKVKFLAALLLFKLCSFSIAFAEEPFVKEIAVRGNRKIGAAAVLKNILTPTGTSLDAELLSADLKRIYMMGYFDDVRVEYDEETMLLTFYVVEKPIVTSIVFSGNKKHKQEDLKAEIRTKELAYIDYRLLKEDITRLEEFYDSKGFFLADIDYSVEEQQPGEVKVEFKLHEGKEVLIRRINITGNKVFTDQEIKKAMRITKEKNWLSFLTDAGTYQAEAFQTDRAIIATQLYGQQGYIAVKVGEPRVTLSADKKHLYLSFHIDEGLQYRVGELDVSGDLIRARDELMDLVSIKEGEIADLIKIRQDVEKIAQLYGDDGYFYVNVVPRTRTQQSDRVVDIDFFIQKGEKVYIEKIEISGNASTRDKVIRREMELDEGDLYSNKKLLLSRFNLERTGYFEEVRITTPRGSADNKIDLKIEVVERSTGAFSVGAGFNSIESFQFIGQVQKRNLFGLGYDIALQTQLGGRTQRFNLRFVDPFFLNTRVGFNFSAFITERQFVNFQQASTGSSVGFVFPLRREGRKRFNLGVNYNFIDENIEDIRLSIASLFDEGITSSMTLSLIRDTRNRVFEPTQGSLLRGSAEFADGEITGDNTFGKFVFDGSVFFPVIPRESWFLPGSVLQFHLNVSYITGLGGDIPLFERFFPGGILSIRGFELRTLGPQIEIASDATPSTLITEDFPIGGNKQLIFNTEYIFPIFTQAGIKGVLFFDVGNAFAEGDSFNIKDLRLATGFGIRWFSPIGPLRFEWGFPLDKTEDESSVVFDFTIGSLF